MKDPVLWRCLFNGNDSLTVGQVFQLHCEGSLGVFFKNSELKLELPKELPTHSLVLLGVQNKSETSFDLSVTSYRTGQIKAPFLRISDGESQVESGELEWEVTSVLKEDAKPYPVKGPFELGLPQSMYLLILFFLVALTLTGGSIFVRKRSQKLLRKELETHQNHQSPIRQFESSLRSLRRRLLWGKNLKSEDRISMVIELEKLVRIYLLRTLKERTLSMPRRKLLQRAFKFKNIKDQQSWVSFFKELELAKNKNSSLDTDAISQLIETSSRILFQLENAETIRGRKS